MFVNYKSPAWYVNAMDQILEKLRIGSEEFDSDLKKLLVLADNVDFARIKLKQAVKHRNKVKLEYSSRMEKLCSKKNFSSNFNLIEFYTEVANTDFFQEVYEGKVLLKDLKEFILEKRNVIKNDLAKIHDIWKKWYRIAYAKEKKEQKAKCRINLTREESLRMIKALTDALKKEPNKDQFIMTFDTDIH